MSSVEQNKALVERFTQAIWQGENANSAFQAPNIVVHQLTSPSGVADLEKTAAYFRAALPDLQVVESMLLGQDDRVMQVYTLSGTHSGIPLFDFPASGRQMSIMGENIFRIQDGKIVEQWGIVDAAGIFQQLSGQ